MSESKAILFFCVFFPLLDIKEIQIFFVICGAGYSFKTPLEVPLYPKGNDMRYGIKSAIFEVLPGKPCSRLRSQSHVLTALKD